MFPGLAAEHPPVSTCLFDGRAHTYCQFTGGELAAYEGVSGRRIWQRGGRSGDGTYPPVILSARHGLLYAVEGPGRHRVLGGLTGAVRERRAGAAPSLVNGFAGLAETDPGAHDSPLIALRTLR